MTITFSKKIKRINNFSFLFLKNSLWTKEMNCPKYEKILNFISDLEIEIKFGSFEKEGQRGSAFFSKIKINSELVGAQKYSTTIHELAHILLDHTSILLEVWHNSIPIEEIELQIAELSAICEVEAQLVSTIILNDMGIKYLNQDGISYINGYKRSAQGQTINYKKVFEVIEKIKKGIQ